MIPHWITLPLYSLIVFLATATSIWAAENHRYECTAYLTELSTKKSKECGTMIFETKNRAEGSYVFTECGNVMVRFSTNSSSVMEITHVQLLKITPQEVRAAQEKRDIVNPKVLTSLSLPADLLPRVFAISHRDEQRHMSATCNRTL